jgi:hypothetical protein
MPPIAEPFFNHLGAHIDFTPAMSAQELKAGIGKAFPNG